MSNFSKMCKGVLASLAFSAALSPALSVSISMCTDQTCGTCPDGLIVSASTDDRPCIVYDTSDITSGGGFPPSDASGQPAYINATPDDDTAISIRSPVDTGTQYCGGAVGFINSANTCGAISLQDTFTIEICHGDQECIDMGITGGPYEPSPPPAKHRIRGTGNLLGPRDDSIKPQNTIFALKRADGSFVKPIAAVLDGEDFMPEFVRLFNATELLPTPTSKSIHRRVGAEPIYTVINQPPPGNDGSCTAFVPDDKNGYIRADATTYSASSILEGGATGNTIQRSDAITTSWTTTVEGGLNFDLFSASVSFSTETSIDLTISYTINVPANQTGQAGWTPFYQCVMGVATCGSDARRGEACSPYQDNGGNPAGEFTFVQNIT